MKGLKRVELTIDQAIDQGVSIETFNALKGAIGRNPFESELKIFHLLCSNGKISAKSIAPLSSVKKEVAFSIDTLKEPEDLKEVAYAILRQPDVISTRFLMEQCKGEIAKKASNSAVITLEGKEAMAFGMEDHALSLEANVESASAIALLDTSRNLVCSGMIPTAVIASKGVAISNTLTRKEVVQVVTGFSTVVDALGLTVEKSAGAAHDLSLINDVALVGKKISDAGQLSLEFKQKGDLIFLFGESKDDVNASVYLKAIHGKTDAPAAGYDLNKEVALQDVLITLIENGMITAAHNVSKGGVFATLIEMSMPKGLGFDIEADGDVRLDAFLFGETQGRAIVTVNEEEEDRFIEFLATIDVPSTLLGHVTKGKLVVDGEHYGFIDEAKDRYNEGLINRLK